MKKDNKGPFPCIISTQMYITHSRIQAPVCLGAHVPAHTLQPAQAYVPTHVAEPKSLKYGAVCINPMACISHT